MKQISKWLSELPEPYRSKAVYYFNEELLNNNYYLNITVSSIEDALARAFDWSQSPEGFSYWCGIMDAYSNHQQDLIPTYLEHIKDYKKDDWDDIPEFKKWFETIYIKPTSKNEASTPSKEILILQRVIDNLKKINNFSSDAEGLLTEHLDSCEHNDNLINGVREIISEIEFITKETQDYLNQTYETNN